MKVMWYNKEFDIAGVKNYWVNMHWVMLGKLIKTQVIKWPRQNIDWYIWLYNSLCIDGLYSTILTNVLSRLTRQFVLVIYHFC